MAVEEPENEWNSDEALNSLRLERSIAPHESNEDLTRRLINDSAPAAAQSIIHLALHAANESTRLKAAQYVTEKVFDPNNNTTQQKWESMIDEVVDNAEQFANADSD